MSVETCRLCLELGSDMANVFKYPMDDNLPSKIEECVSIQILEEDELPQTVCKNCIHQVMLWFEFKEKCLLSKDKLCKRIDETDLKNIEICKEENRLQFDGDLSSCSDSDSEILDEIFLQNDSCIKNKIKTENIYNCEICSQEFDSCFDYLDHQPIHNGQLVFNCNKCAESFVTRCDLVEHDKNHRIPCSVCGKVILKSSMKLHMVKHTDRHICSFCSNRFPSRAGLAQHIITVHSTLKNHICDHCGKQFSSSSAMKVHIKSHSERREYSCKYCNYAGKTASAVYIHMATHAQEICICEICSKTFKSNRNLYDHLRRVHNADKKHECQHCDKKFVDKYMLKVHERTHTGVRPYTCNVCGKTFVRSDGLKEHTATHEQRIPHCCELCGKKFTSKRGLTRHNCAT